MSNEYVLDKLFKLFLALLALDVYFGLLLGQSYGIKGFSVLILVPVFLAIALKFRYRRNFYRMLDYLKENWGTPIEKKRNLERTKKYHLLSKKEDEEDIIDDQTWGDLTMDEIYAFLDRNLSTPGEHMLYDILRRPLKSQEEIHIRKAQIDLFSRDKELRDKLRTYLYICGRERAKDGNIVELLFKEHEFDESMMRTCNVAAAMPLVLLCMIPFFKSAVIFPLIISFGINMYIHNKSLTSNEGLLHSIQYLSKVIKCAGEISEINNAELNHYIEPLKGLYNKFKNMIPKASVLAIPDNADIILEYFKTIFLIDERNYYKIIKDINSHRYELNKVYSMVGTLDALVSIASYRDSNTGYVEPEFSKDNANINIEGLSHPLLEEAVPNDICIKGGIIITGSNMSGKSTFLRAVGVNAILAQTIVMVMAKKYEAPFLNIMTSISPQDDINEGKSYYLGEAEALLRIINNCNREYTTLCIIDEIFRGTNPIERVAASTEILKYFMARNALVVVATHDLELTELLRDKYACYYFTEDVDNEEGLKFDYKIRAGVSPTRNAIKLLDYLGYPKEIVEAAKLNS
ncbi:MutS family DNA mismatch repair protein [Clostridium sp. 19966]|uniref:MutS-related protein n=1 Tax=Clostridium sp. 19966 TaxID=2768166 RepID=UPI0028DE757D|nr:MutS family DNA mismatch repair protein [Clostridium sp. 19966]MDT8715514.1 MutS family DNA mismatch repair protein [Clostridium sp. 19966]